MILSECSIAPELSCNAMDLKTSIPSYCVRKDLVGFLMELAGFGTGSRLL
jgi:hypothetical protein